MEKRDEKKMRDNMMSHSLHSNKKKTAQKGKAVLKILLSSCAIIIFLSGIALAADRDVIIGFHKEVGQSEKELIKSHGGATKKSFHLIPAISARVPEDIIEQMKKDPKIAYIEDDKIFEAADEYTNSWGVQHIGSQSVHVQGINGTGVKIAILDTGIDYNHEDLKDNYKGGIGFVQNPDGSVNPSNFDDNYESHGTHVAGIIAAENNGIGVVGVAPKSDIYAIKVLDGAGFGYASWVIAGIEWVVDNKIDIATMSLGSSQDDPDLHSLKIACDNAYNAGVLLVAAAGNTNGGNITYPAGFDSVIAVTATDQNDQKTSFSPIDPKIELSAPGVNINSTIKSTYGQLSGTSQATPHVTGTAALLISSHNLKDLNGDRVVNNKDVRLQLQQTAKDLGSPGKDDTYGFGLVDAQAAVLGTAGQPKPIILVLNRTSAPPAGDVKNVSLSNAEYEITIRNHGLNKVDVDVFEHGASRSDLSSKYKFSHSKLQEVNFRLNTAGTTFDIIFTPYGKPTTSADVTIDVFTEGIQQRLRGSNGCCLQTVVTSEAS
jgi:subtilisin